MVEIELGPVGVHGQRGVTMLPSSLARTSGLAWRGQMMGFWVPVAWLVGRTGLLYFSAHWCSPCRKFLPKLIEEYIKMREETSSDVEVVFVSNTDGQEKRNCHVRPTAYILSFFTDM
ncbi:hypothetical protein OsJ_33399 [Oryza sativa Japonica Group]|uniref:protein-disulfide reductase n=1 Tax=Oryza sativa subsp. japonica TaxID=39947 RepID=B9GA08_ORYSJ|nr:hypothetical protein OsJ_33399 [Oryza sativa Japonica Group]